jgi:polyphosphate kinase 2 (PPK2 family)
MDRNELVEQLCIVMHDAYEQAAIETGWQTQARSRKPWILVPEENKATMRVAVTAMLSSGLVVPA